MAPCGDISGIFSWFVAARPCQFPGANCGVASARMMTIMKGTARQESEHGDVGRRRAS